jgi:cobalt-zinc-cadmium efflux system membrane fusion protein
MKKRFFFVLSLSILVLIFSGFFARCGKAPISRAAGSDEEQTPVSTHADDGHTHEGETADHAGTAGHRYLEVSPEIIKQWGIQYAEAGERDYIETVVLTGVVRENKKTTFIINALVPGIVTAVKKDIGDPVKKGDILCILNSSALLELKTRYIKAFQGYRLSKENYERTKSLFKIKAIEKKQLISRETDYKTAMAEYFSLEARLDTLGFGKQMLQSVKAAVKNDETGTIRSFLSSYYDILSPGAGKVMARNLSLGERVETTTVIFEISDVRKMWVMLDALEKDLPYIGKDKIVQVETDVYPGEYFEGKVLILMERIDPELRTVKVRVEVDNPGGRLKPEMYVRGRMDKLIKKKLPSVPVAALVKLSGVDGVFVIEEGEFLFKAVRVVETDSAGFSFLKGINPGDMVVTTGAFYLKAEYEIQRGGGTDSHAGHGH